MPPPLSSIRRALQILQTFSAERPEMGVTEVSRFLGVHKSSISRIIGTLASEGFLEKNPETGRYRLGLKLLDLGDRVLGRYDLRNDAAPFMEELAQKTREIIHLSILDKNQIVYLDKKGEGQALTVGTKIGGRNPAHASSMGKVLLSGLPSHELMEALSMGPLLPRTPSTITKIPDLLKELDKVKRQGFAIDNEESFPGIRCVAAPVYDRTGKIVASLSVTAPKQRMGQQRLREVRERVIAAARSISRRLGMIEPEKE
jgi:IclR family transcriptional regulator, KDG regulon repressor